MGSLESYSIDIIGLSNKVHQFQFEIGDGFFKQYGPELLEKGKFSADVTLDKRETMIEVGFQIKGNAGLICDRCLEPFDLPMLLHHKIIFKYGQEEKEISDDMVMITHGTERLELGQYMYEFIALAIPMKKLHPKFQGETDEDDALIYKSEKEGKKETDPRWEALKKLNKN